MREIAGKVINVIRKPFQSPEVIEPSNSPLNRRNVSRRTALAALPLGLAALGSVVSGAVEAKPADAQAVDAVKPAEGYRGSAPAASVTQVRQEGGLATEDGAGAVGSDATPPIPPAEVEASVPPVGGGENQADAKPPQESGVSAESQKERGIKTEAKSEAREALEKAFKPIFDRQTGSKDDEVYHKAEKMVRELIADCKEADGEFKAAGVWLENHNLDVTTTVTRGVTPSGSEVGYGSVFTMLALSEADIRNVVDGTFIPDDPANPSYATLLDQRFGYFRTVVDYTLGNRKFKLLVHRFIVNADKSDTFNGSDIVDLALMARKTTDFDEKFMSDGRARVTDIAQLRANLNSLDFQNNVHKKEANIVYTDLDRLITGDSGYWRLSPFTQKELDSFRKLRAS